MELPHDIRIQPLMASVKLITAFLFFSPAYPSTAQTKVDANAGSWTPYNCTAAFEDGVIHVMNSGNGTALFWLNDYTFTQGVIELDIKGKDLAGQSFVGLAFHSSGDEEYEAVYFRPFNFSNPDRKDHAVQYISKPEYDWSVLRQRFPGKYENQITPAPDPNDWFHVKIVIEYPRVSAFVNNSSSASLTVEQISKRQDGKIGLWVDSQDGWFRNITISK